MVDKPSPISEDLFKKICEIIDMYPYARAAVLHYESITLEGCWIGLSNLRDVLDHFHRVVNEIKQGDKKSVENDLNYAKEHMRRAITESAQELIEHRLTEIKIRLRVPKILYKIVLLKTPSHQSIKKIEKEIKVKIEEGRNIKSTDWKHALENFTEAEELLENLDQNIPPTSELGIRLIALIGVIIGIIGLIFYYN